MSKIDKPGTSRADKLQVNQKQKQVTSISSQEGDWG